ncbi:type IV fimbrial biogenesis protein FimT [Variovorax sp. HW608]|uniref:GspH/FimT family pseudopilin n=1 Tax=Variovorax sp. HW608 TaxID=1034889 RepID=UPI00081FE72A|nr:GspH/FimT family pseudopilin [Variovorax sp. HW608]SCK62024.1 type IV fimbrial biogenesis protein FimT [Variovorax sp. HW608]
MRQRGFTLVELVVAIAVLGLVMFAVLPSIGTWLDNTRIRNVAASLQNGLQLARGEAVRRNQSVSFWLVSLNDPSTLSNDCALSNTSGSWVVSVNSPIGHCADPPSTVSSPMIVTGRAVGDAGGRVSVTAVQTDGTTAGTAVTFNGFGRLDATTNTPIAQIDVTGTGTTTNYRKLRVAITAAGEVRMCDPDTSVAANDPRKC